jgi:histidyl-tRNA synthetase
MDIWGVEGVEAEAELLAAVVQSFEEMGLDAADVGIKVNNRKLLGTLAKNLGIPDDKFAATCVLIDKLEKVPLEAIQSDLDALGLSANTISELTEALSWTALSQFSEKLGSDCQGVSELEKLFSLAEAYGYADWLTFDASVVRGLAYYTGTVFEGFDRSGELRAICGGGRYDQLLTSFGGKALPAVGFGFGDAVIVELLKTKDLLPDLAQSRVEAMMYCLDEGLRTEAISLASKLRAEGIQVDLVLEAKKSKWVFNRAEKCGASCVIQIAPDEMAEGKVVVKSLVADKQAICALDAIGDCVRNMVRESDGL